MVDLDASVAYATKRHAEAVSTHTEATLAASEASEDTSAASAAFSDLWSRQHEIDYLARKIDQLSRHKQVLFDAGERQADHKAALLVFERARQAHSQAIFGQAQARVSPTGRAHLQMPRKRSNWRRVPAKRLQQPRSMRRLAMTRR